MIQQLAAPCWYVDREPREEPHYDTREQAQADEDQRAADDERQPLRAQQHQQPCWLVICDACDEEIEDPDEGRPWHHSTRADAVAFEQAETVDHDGQRLCRGCADDRRLPPPSPPPLDLTIPLDLIETSVAR